MTFSRSRLYPSTAHRTRILCWYACEAKEHTHAPTFIGPPTFSTVILQMVQVYTPEEGHTSGDELLFSASDGTQESDAVVTFTFIARDDLPVAWTTTATVAEDEARGVRVELNGSDIDSEFVTFLLTRLPSKGKLFVVDRSDTRTLIESAFSGFEVEPS